ncbi:MAG: sodium-dependent dicarboxylate transporter 2/3/5 [Candidatus Omnitrophota bacterium]|jgi:sodium-dependent dicarboxylate transporter 2/3/5
MRQKIGLILGPMLFIAILLVPRPEGLSPEGQRALAIAALMAVWWVTEAAHIAVTALIPLALFPLMSVLPMVSTAKNYANPNIYLFMGGFMIAMSMQKWNLHKRLALLVIQAIGSSPRQLMAGFMLSTAFLSMWISNTATVVMMLPIALGVIAQIDSSDQRLKKFGLVLMLGIAYSASAGGVATLIGTPPNIIFAGQVQSLLPEYGEIGFVTWIQFGLPLALGFLILIWAYLTFIVGKLPNGLTAEAEVIKKELRQLGAWSWAEKMIMVIFSLTALAWLTRTDIQIGTFNLVGWSTRFNLQGVHDGTIAMAAALLLFVIPANLKGKQFLLDWAWASKLPWDVLILFGGGFALAESVKATGLAEWLGGGFILMQGMPIVLIVLCICLGMTFLTEVTSNTATATMVLPILAAASVTLNIPPLLLMIPATVSASFAFMLPVATPPNAIIFGSGKVTIPQMAKAGFALNIIGALWITLAVFVLARPIFNF